MNVEIEAEAAPFPEKEYIYGIFVAVYIRRVTSRSDSSRDMAGQNSGASSSHTGPVSFLGQPASDSQLSAASFGQLA